MWNLRKTILTSLAVCGFGAIWYTKAVGQENVTSGIITVFDHEKVDASFAKAMTNDGSNLLWSLKSSNGNTDVQTHNRESVRAACKPEGCSHKDYTAVVYVVSGAATLVVGGTARGGLPDNFDGQSIQGGESHRISKGDVYIVPPDTVHWYKDVEVPFHYLGARPRFSI